jgi:hypothetical protein
MNLKNVSNDGLDRVVIYCCSYDITNLVFYVSLWIVLQKRCLKSKFPQNMREFATVITPKKQRNAWNLFRKKIEQN